MIAGAAAALHGCAGTVADVDVLTVIADADRAIARLALPPDLAAPSDRFRSERFARWAAPPLPVQIMAGFAVRTAEGWHPIAPSTRERVAIGGRCVFVPARGELAGMLRLFGRPKDLARAAFLDG